MPFNDNYKNIFALNQVPKTYLRTSSFVMSNSDYLFTNSTVFFTLVPFSFNSIFIDDTVIRTSRVFFNVSFQQLTVFKNIAGNITISVIRYYQEIDMNHYLAD